jgi:cytochrome c-type biogenesis protein CcmH
MNRKNLLPLWLLILPSLNLYALAQNPIDLPNAEQEQRYQHLTQELRCVVCQNQSIADSNAELAQDIRQLVAQKMLEGQTDEQITQFLVERYGDFVLYDPPIEPKTYVLWLAPIVMAFVAFFMVMYFIRRHIQTTAIPPPLTDAERNKVNNLLGE